MTEIPVEEIELVFGVGAVASATRQLRKTPPLATAGLWRVVAGTDSAVLKLVALRGGTDSRWPASPDESDPYYWRREPLAYASGLLDRLTGGLRAPFVRAVVERPDGSIALWLEDVSAEPRWTPELAGTVARRLGRAQAAFAAAPPLDPWLSRGWLRAYLALHDVLDAEAESVLTRLDELPQTLCHHDLHPANLLGDDGSVVVDWAYCGLGALGLDAGVLVADGIADAAFPVEVAHDVADRVWAGYRDGLREGGWHGAAEDVRWAYLRGTSVRLSWLRRGLARLPRDDPRREPWAATVALLDEWRDEARELASRA